MSHGGDKIYILDEGGLCCSYMILMVVWFQCILYEMKFMTRNRSKSHAKKKKEDWKRNE